MDPNQPSLVSERIVPYFSEDASKQTGPNVAIPKLFSLYFLKKLDIKDRVCSGLVVDIRTLSIIEVGFSATAAMHLVPPNSIPPIILRT